MLCPSLMRKNQGNSLFSRPQAWLSRPPLLGHVAHSFPGPRQTSPQPRSDHLRDHALESTLLHSWWGCMPRHSPQILGLSPHTGRLPPLFCNLELCHWQHGAEVYHLTAAVAIQLCFCKGPRYSHSGWPDQLVPSI